MKRSMFSIRSKLMFTHLLVALVALVVTGISFNTMMQNYSDETAFKGLIKQAEVYRDAYVEELMLTRNQSGQGAKRLPQDQRQLSTIRMLLNRVQSRYLADSDFYVISVENRMIERSNQESMLGQKFSLSIGESYSGVPYSGSGVLNQQPVLYVAMPIDKEPGIHSHKVVVVAANQANISAVSREIFMKLLDGILITLCVVAIVVLFFVRSLIKPFKLMGQAVKKLSQGDFSPTPILNSRDEWEELSTAFHQMVEDLRNYNEGQRRFLQHASHELKTPLTSIQGYAEGIRDGLFQGTEAEEGLEIIRVESIRLKKLVDELIYLSKLETLEDIYTPETIDLAKLVPDAISRIGSLTKPKGVSVQVTQLQQALVHVDPDKMTQALLNLLSNALRHARREVGIGIFKEGSKVSIEVWDDGSGIDESDADRIFERFYHGAKGETGLGLAITRAIVEKCKGSIEARNRSPEGALFKIILPVL